MPAKDHFHDHVRTALKKDGWTITDDPLTIVLEGTRDNLFVDLGAERLIAAEKAAQKIAVEVKSFISGCGCQSSMMLSRRLYDGYLRSLS